MPSAWLLPDHLSDVLPAEAQRLEGLRTAMLAVARGHGYELVVPPLLEHAESLATEGAVRSFKVVDQLSGRLLALRDDTTPQVARIDAHRLNREGVVRLCYCGPVLHTRPQAPLASREPMQWGAELYGHAGLEADLEVLDLSIEALQAAHCGPLVVDLGDARILRGVLAGLPVDARVLRDVGEALAGKNAGAVDALAARFPAEAREGLRVLTGLFGDTEVLARARAALPARQPVRAALDDLQRVVDWVACMHPQVQLGIDLADSGGQDYYSALRFSVYTPGVPDAVLRGGRYDEVGAAFGRNRPAVGCGADLKRLAASGAAQAPAGAVRAPWPGDDAALRDAVARLRAQGEIVITDLPGAARDAAAGEGARAGEALVFDRELVAAGGRWVLKALP